MIVEAKILVVDDSLSVQEPTAHFLREAGYEVFTAGTGQEGLELADREKPDLILLDVSLPDLSGVEVCQRLKQTPQTSTLFIVLISSFHTSSQAATTGLESGADAYLSRPIDNTELLARLEALLRIQKAENALRQANAELEQRVEQRTTEWRQANSALQQEIQERIQAEDQQRRLAQRLEIMHKLDQAVLAAQSPGAIAEAASGWIAKLASCDHVSLLEWDEETHCLNLMALHESFPRKTSPSLPFSLPDWTPCPDTLSGKMVLRHQVPLLINKLSPPDNKACWDEVLEAPLIADGELMGLVTLASCRNSKFNDEHRDIAQEIADSIAVALQNARWTHRAHYARRRLEALSLKLLEVQEAERRSVARELHDQIGQLLTGLRMSLEMIDKPGRAHDQGSLIMEALDVVKELTERVRTLSMDMRPHLLDDLGLLPALEWHFQRFQKQSGIQIHFRHSPFPEALPARLETAVFRIVQESLTNVARHAQVEEAHIRLWIDPSHLRVQIEDHGVGFDNQPSTLVQDSSGLFGMKERTELLNGEFILESAPGEGTSLTVEFPILPEAFPSPPLHHDSPTGS